tara:strand:+ start:139 stop:669 length:531 start_codon:yes stop_codon:yes gene_type:complete
MIKFPDKKYNIIYADPPWKYKRDGNYSAFSNYNVMDIKSIKNLDVNNICAEQSHLYLWVTNPFIQEGLDVCRAWGFDYKTLITWVKTYKDGTPQMGMGYYFRGCTEHIIFGVKGKMKCLNKTTKNMFADVNQKHSQKPKQVKDMIVSCSGDLPRIELFARNIGLFPNGWDSWGDEV